MKKIEELNKECLKTLYDDIGELDMNKYVVLEIG